MKKAKATFSRMGRYTLAAISLYCVGWLIAWFSPESIFAALKDLGFLLLLGSLGVYLYRLLAWAKRGLFWKVRNKIIVSYAFVGIIPMLILLLISWFVLVLFFRQLSVFYLNSELESIVETIDDMNRRIEVEYLREGRTGADPAEALGEQVTLVLREIPNELNSIRASIHECSVSEGKPVYIQTRVYGVDGELPVPPDIHPPDWLQDGFSGFTSGPDGISLTTAVAVEDCLRLVLKLPFDETISDDIRRRTSIEEMEIVPSNPGESPSEFEMAFVGFSDRQSFFSIAWAHFFTPAEWETGKSGESQAILVSTPLWALLNAFFAQAAGTIMTIIVGLAIAFVLVELFSLLIGAAIARGITVSIHNIYKAVENIQKGNFNFRVVSRKKDQLDAMADSFNEVSESIVRLMGEVSQREALEKEVEIAREVQRQLFPSRMPGTFGLEFAASCTPALRVSGDYYDFLSHDRDRIDIVVGDISGKGISAALLMASTQATIRDGLGRENGRRPQPQRLVHVVEEVNRQLYRRSSPESYSTLILSHFDAQTATLAYCNAGHHPPLVFSDGKVNPLTVGGTVVGLFENWKYQGAEVKLAEGDLVVYFTDGVVEAAKADGEQFGTERLIELVRSNTFLTAEDIQSLILEQVFDWAGEEEQADDVTVVCMKLVEKLPGG